MSSARIRSRWKHKRRVRWLKEHRERENANEAASEPNFQTLWTRWWHHEHRGCCVLYTLKSPSGNFVIWGYINSKHIYIINRLLLQLSGTKARLALAAAAPPPNPLHSFQTGMPIFRVLLSAVMAVGSLASFNPSLPLARWLAEGLPLRTNPPRFFPPQKPTPPRRPLSNVKEEGGGAWMVAKKK